MCGPRARYPNNHEKRSHPPRFRYSRTQGYTSLSRTLNDDFDEDDLPSGSLDLDKGTGQAGGGIPSTYGNDGIDFDDDLYGSDDPAANKALELDLPHAPGKPSGAPAGR